ncbi:16S rRNA (guanine(527)-N(7))-methyltransferase RsmG [Roseburia hominis]|uniref:16S rRNA (guanine(527)-N(7))-methyltransferase RsmG n=1 Tax=Roseburia hominis TaxID=301301 RepID=UPI001F2BBF0A|nr:16S rRNA (guanine(527)-N(7))-methyltransferase RsmG [Roseburia hominis]MCI5712314.1 16S rRNA (guanine(527)-N(7))-methyltransferase RsmG [Lachnospiraceae bacterium]
MTYDFKKFEAVLKKWNLVLTEEQKNQFLTYYEMLVEKNKVMNLTSVTEFNEVVEKHFLDSISLWTIEDLSQRKKVLDLGTGAGFPGIPLKIMFPELEITLADSLNKRILFLQEVIDALKLQNISAIHGRAEEMAKQENFRESYDLCVSRAVANLSTLSEYCLPFVRIGGKFISYKSGEIEEEQKNAKNAVFLLGGKIEKIHKFELDGTELKRSFVVIDKVKKTPKLYPRKAGTPAKNPLS